MTASITIANMITHQRLRGSFISDGRRLKKEGISFTFVPKLEGDWDDIGLDAMFVMFLRYMNFSGCSLSVPRKETVKRMCRQYVDTSDFAGTNDPCLSPATCLNKIAFHKKHPGWPGCFTLAERAGFEPANLCGLHAFQACALSQTTRPLHFQRANYTMCYSGDNIWNQK